MSRVVSGTTGNKLLCCFDDCDRLGDTRWQITVREPQRNVIYVFCGETHRAMYAHGHKEYLQLPAGSKSLARYVGGADLPGRK